MTPRSRPLRELLQALADPAQRESAARALAEALGAQRLLLYVKDPALAVMLPAAGMPKTVAGGPQWRAFLRRCLTEARPAGTVDVPAGAELPAQAVTRDGAALILLGALPPGPAVDELAEAFPLLAQLLNAQQALQLERAEVASARSSAAQAHELAQALATARAASAELNLQLRQEHERKDEFLAMLAHELRNPLAPLANSVDLLRRRPAMEEAARAHQLDVMTRQLQQLTRLVDDLLDVSRVSRGQIALRRERLALQEVLDDAIEAVRPLLEQRSHTLLRLTGATTAEVHGDRVRLTQAFVNLMTNAAKYTAEGGRISVSVVLDQHRVSVVLQDSGMGIPQDMLSRVFDMFTQVPSPLVRSQGGLGIGLTLVRRLVELHGGRVSAYSRGERQGSTFTVSLPLVTATAIVPVSRPGPAPEAVPSALLQAMRVLVVDDNRDGAETLAALVEVMGAQARIAHEGQEALRLAESFDPKLILLDIGLPGMDGYETARRLRQLPALHARLVALTGFGSPADRERALAAGFDAHVVKPLAPEVMQGLLAPMHLPS